MYTKENTISLVSIILPTFNGSKFISKAIESVLSQTFSDFELIIINDCSVDKTQIIVDSYKSKDSRIISLANVNTVGIVESLNKGIKISNGKYIARIDDDDTWSDINKLKEQVNFLERNPEYGLVGTKARIIDTDNNIIGELGTLVTDEKIRKNIMISNPFCHSSIVFRKKILGKEFLYHKLKYTEDWDLWIRIGLISKFKNLDIFGVNYLKRKGMSSKNTKSNQIYYQLKILLKYGFRYPKTLISILKLINYAIFY